MHCVNVKIGCLLFSSEFADRTKYELWINSWLAWLLHNNWLCTALLPVLLKLFVPWKPIQFHTRPISMKSFKRNKGNTNCCRVQSNSNCMLKQNWVLVSMSILGWPKHNSKICFVSPTYIYQKYLYIPHISCSRSGIRITTYHLAKLFLQNESSHLYCSCIMPHWHIIPGDGCSQWSHYWVSNWLRILLTGLLCKNYFNLSHLFNRASSSDSATTPSSGAKMMEGLSKMMGTGAPKS